MKSLKLCFESLLDDEDIFLDPKNDKKVIEEWIRNNYKITGKLIISDDFVVDCKGSVYRNFRLETMMNYSHTTQNLNKSVEVAIKKYCDLRYQPLDLLYISQIVQLQKRNK